MADEESTARKIAPVPKNDNVFDISVLATEDTVEMVINHPVTGEPTQWVWTIAGPGHPAAVAADREAGDEARRDAHAQEKAKTNGRKWNPDFVDTEEQSRKNAVYFAKKVLSWTPVRISGADFPHNHANVVKILLDPHYLLVYRQLLDFITEEKSFMKPSSLN